MTGLRDLVQIAVYGVGLGVVTMAALHFGYLFTRFRDQRWNGPTVTSYRKFPNYVNQRTDWEEAYQMLPYFAAGGAVFAVIATIFTIGLLEVVA